MTIELGKPVDIEPRKIEILSRIISTEAERRITEIDECRQIIEAEWRTADAAEGGVEQINTIRNTE